MAMIFCNIGWMGNYKGLKGTGDKIVKGGKYVEENQSGHEVCNFLECDGKVFGYVQPPISHEINIEIIAENHGLKINYGKLTGVTVIWIATRPKELGKGKVIVGWYVDATVYKEYQKHVSYISNQHECDELDGYFIEAKAKDAYLIPVGQRNFEISKGKGLPGRSNIFYGDSSKKSNEETEKLVAKVRKYIDDYMQVFNRYSNLLDSKSGAGAGAGIGTGWPAKQDLERKAAVEQAAMDKCRDHYKNLQYLVEDVSKENLGWDIEAKNCNETLRIEVKGLFGKEPLVEITPNEYKAFREEKLNYRLAIVTNALAESQLFICRFIKEGGWIVEDENGGNTGKKLNITPRANVRIY